MTATHTQDAALSPAAQSSPLARQYALVRQLTEELAAPLSPEDQMLQSMPDASPTKWHLAHTTWFFETFLLAAHLPGYRRFDPHFGRMFNSYYKQLGGHPQRTTRGLFSRPGLDEVIAYRRHVDRHMAHLLEEPSPEAAALAVLGLNHEQQHQELIVTDIKHALSLSPLPTAYASGAVPATGATLAPPLAWVEFNEGLYHIGHEGAGFAFDNEGPRHTVFLQSFRLATRPVTNREYLDFIEAGGYRTPSLWLSDGWDAVVAASWQAPLYWEQHDGRWTVFTCSGEQPLHPEEPVCHLSYYEADAFARWAGARLPTEAEWEVAAAAVPVEGNLLEQRRFHPAPAAAAQPTPQLGLQQMFGEVWEWTASPYVAYPGFQPAAGALGEYNGKFMCNQMVLRGGSCATPRSHLRASYRNFFPAAARWQFSGVRLAR